MDRERRRFQRRLFCIPVIIKDDKRGYFYVDHTTDISEGGLLIHSSNIYSPGKELEVLFRFPDSLDWIKCKCLVVWSTKVEDLVPAMGLRFISISEKGKKVLKRYIEKEVTPPIIDD